MPDAGLIGGRNRAAFCMWSTGLHIASQAADIRILSPPMFQALADAPEPTRPEVLAHLAVLRPKAARIAVLIAVIALGLGIPAG